MNRFDLCVNNFIRGHIRAGTEKSIIGKWFGVHLDSGEIIVFESELDCQIHSNESWSSFTLDFLYHCIDEYKVENVRREVDNLYNL